MKNLAFLPFVALTFFCWGLYGPTIHTGQELMGDYENTEQLSTLRSFICVGLAYFMVAVVYPIVVLVSRGEKGYWTSSGVIWSFAAGTVGAFGALGIILAFKFRGSPVFVMPLVFGCAPVVNTFVTMLMTKSLRRASPVFFLGVLVVAVGAAGVLTFKPANRTAIGQEITKMYPEFSAEIDDDGAIVVNAIDQNGSERNWKFKNLNDLKEDEDAYPIYRTDRARKRQPTLAHWLLIAFSIAMTATCWGSYGAVLHRGQMKMAGSRLRPFMCVGLAYFTVAVVFPVILMPAFPPEAGGWSHIGGVIWSLLGGMVGAFGALGIVYAFNFGGKPIFVMPLVFGCAPVVNTFFTMTIERTLSSASVGFFMSLLLVICGAVTVLIFAPRPEKSSSASAPSKPSKATPVGATFVEDEAELSDGSEASGKSMKAEEPNAETRSD